MSEEERMAKEDLDRVKAAADALGEHFDSVQILVSRHEPGILDGTATVAWGVGNFLSRYGQVKLWIKEKEAHDLEEGDDGANYD